MRMAAGDSNKLIARAFDLSLHTVKRHVAHILNKLTSIRAARRRPGIARTSLRIRTARLADVIQ